MKPTEYFNDKNTEFLQPENIYQATIDQLSRMVHNCNFDIIEVYKGINKQAGRLTTVMHNLKIEAS